MTTIKEYFSHDYFAREDPKFDDLLLDHGWAGYGLYWACVEILYEREGKILKSSLQGLASRLGANYEVVQDIFTKYGLFLDDGESYYSESATERLEKRKEKSDKARRSVSARYGRNADEERTNYERITIKGKVKDKEINFVIAANYLLKIDEKTRASVRSSLTRLCLGVGNSLSYQIFGTDEKRELAVEIVSIASSFDKPFLVKNEEIVPGDVFALTKQKDIIKRISIVEQRFYEVSEGKFVEKEISNPFDYAIVVFMGAVCQ